jgi:hypothetical protein
MHFVPRLCGVWAELSLVTGSCNVQRLFNEQRAAEDARSDNGTTNRPVLIGALDMFVSFVENVSGPVPGIVAAKAE